YLCSDNDVPKCIIKVSSGDGIMNSHAFTIERVQAAANALRENHVAPPILMKGADFHVETSVGDSVMKDFFHFQLDLAPPQKLAQLMAHLHSTPTAWYAPLKEKFLRRDPVIADTLRDVPPHAPAWCLPWSGIDTGMPVLGAGNPDPALARKILSLQLETGVFHKIMNCSTFYPVSDAAKREVVIHNDFKPDNILRDPNTGKLTAIDYDLVQVGPAVIDFGLPYMMWLGSRFTTFEFRKNFITAYLIASNFPADEASVHAFMLDCEVYTIVAFPGLLSNIYDAEIPLLRGVQHPTAKAGVQASGPDASPTGLELVDLLSEAVEKVRADSTLCEESIQNGLIVTLFKRNGLGSEILFRFLKEMQKNRMLRLFGIAETDDGELFVAEHARK
ncbi:MAG: phosphotransferase, partial [Myxococcota bacterium]|nr:phosphotransferase [Myxococcota bacterium]